MIYYISTLILLIAFLLHQYFTFIRIYYIGQSLHKFRELRCEITLFLSANVKKNLSIKEATEYKQFLLNIDAIIKHFDQFKTELTKFKSVKTIYSNILFSSEKLATHSNNTTILQQYKVKLGECILTAFNAIPFCRVRLLMFFLRLLANLSFTLGKGRLGKKLHTIEQLYKIEKDIIRKKSISCNP